ncbi:NAD(P)-binding protein [Pseudovirgaria hyperparasitica]|uniref:NAD(P)-binding protein n=1 Tax=Pseudovirgaria hyperparasitica TaxID=470096 RepID=A0A6A6WGD6_9PEZI|nr:NAD(P)-binding protein [Pseudovirgaria hyperparasitica]KAF2761912.1 NAD(P)-binding protein [Pseudovirgaria hyperparasitica]
MDTTKPLDVSTQFSAKDEVIVVTGGGTGIGLAIASALAHSGAKRVYILGRRLDLLQDAACQYHNVTPLQCDVTSIDSIRTAVEVVRKESDHVDVLINNAGIIGPNHLDVHKAETIEDLSGILLRDWDKWEPTFATNTTAIVGVSAAFLPLLDAANRRKGWESGRKVAQRARSREINGLAEGVDGSDPRTAQIISVTSIVSFNRNITDGLAYSSSKAGATHVAKMLTTLLAPWGIRSNVIAPGFFPSEMTASITDKSFPPEMIPAGRQGSYEDIASLALFLVGRSGAYQNGVVQMPDGGRISVQPATY